MLEHPKEVPRAREAPSGSGKMTKQILGAASERGWEWERMRVRSLFCRLIVKFIVYRFAVCHTYGFTDACQVFLPLYVYIYI